VALPTLVFRLVYPEQPYFLIAAAAGMVGHNWPIYYRFKGGGGMSSIYGGLLVVDWLGAIVCSTAGMIFGFFVVRDILVAYLAGAWFVIPWLWLRTHDPAYVIYAVAINILFILAMLPSIRHQMKSRREGKTDMTAGLESFPMGQGMLKMMNFFKRDKPKSES
jgi:glycerol-3-phosphate acyltransferase PlsY